MPAPVAAGAFAILLARLFGFAWTKIAPAASVASRTGAGRAGMIGLTIGTVAADLLNIDELRQEAVRIAPASDPEALEEAARQIMRMTGADGSSVIWGPGNPRYYHFDLTTGNAWFTERYNSQKAKRAWGKAQLQRGIRIGKSEMATTAMVGKG